MSQGPREHIPDELIDAFFDGELDDVAAGDLFRQLPKDAARYEQVAKTQRMISLLRAPEECPDLTRNILHEVDRRRGFLSTSMRRFVRAGRLAAAAVVLLAFLGIAAAQRYSPDTFRMKDQPRPVAQVVDDSCSAAAMGCERVRSLHSEVRNVISPLAEEFDRVAIQVECNNHAKCDSHTKTFYVTAKLQVSTLASAPTFSTDTYIASQDIALGSGEFDGRSLNRVVYLDNNPQHLVMPIGFVSSIRPGMVNLSSTYSQENPFVLPETQRQAPRADLRFVRPWSSGHDAHTRP